MANEVNMNFFTLNLTANTPTKLTSDSIRTQDFLIQSSTENTLIVKVGNETVQCIELRPGASYTASEFFRFGKERDVDLTGEQE